MTDPLHANIAADLLEEQGFPDEAQTLRDKAELLQVVHEILTLCRATIEHDHDLIRNADMIGGSAFVPATEIIIARTPDRVAALIQQHTAELAAKFAEALVERFAQRPDEADRLLTPHDWRQRLNQRRQKELARDMEAALDEQIANQEREAHDGD